MTANAFEKQMDVEALVALAQDVATVRTRAPLPPGSRVGFEICGVALHAKVVSISKGEQDDYQVRVRLASVRKSQWDVLRAALPGAEE